MILSIENELVQLYQKHAGNLIDIYHNYSLKEEKVSSPLLLNCFPEYLNVKNKIMVFGKETFGWHNKCLLNKENLVSVMMDKYSQFQLGENHKESPFWAVSNKLYRMLNPDATSRLGFIWNNINKADENKSRLRSEYEDIIYRTFPVTQGEIEIFNPNIIVFFTASNYDNRLKTVFSGVQFESIPDFSETELVRVRHDNLPINTFRTIHPRSMRFNKKPTDLFLKTIVQNIK
ncbi:MAG: hypothetical protein K0S39_532 [Paenibacillus sp.]|jgi:hypothetical protein|nr:hypothetical protein [Paenibacillus sp.]